MATAFGVAFSTLPRSCPHLAAPSAFRSDPHRPGCSRRQIQPEQIRCRPSTSWQLNVASGAARRRTLFCVQSTYLRKSGLNSVFVCSAVEAAPAAPAAPASSAPQTDKYAVVGEPLTDYHLFLPQEHVHPCVQVHYRPCCRWCTCAWCRSWRNTDLGGGRQVVHLQQATGAYP